MISAFLNRITMYRLMVYYLTFLCVVAMGLSLAGVLPYSWLDILETSIYLNLACFVFNQLLARLFQAKTNVESQSITALILTLIVGPMALLPNIFFLTLLALLAMASKYVLVWKKQHIFNPAAIAVLLAALFLGQGASWWIGSVYLFPFLLLGGGLILIKIKRLPLVGAFLLTYVLGLLVVTLVQGGSLGTFPATLANLFTRTSLLFFAGVMLVEPYTAPGTDRQRLIYGGLTGLLLVVLQTFVLVPYTLELALVLANVYSLAVRPDGRLIMTLKKIDQEAQNITRFTFEPSRPLKFEAGQYLEWTLPHPHADTRGVRRYFTIASPPTQDTVALVTKFAADRSSSFKAALQRLKPGATLSATHVQGEFTLPSDAAQPLVFIAGGIGVTPFLSMAHYLLDTKQTRDAVLLYSARSSAEFVCPGLFKKAEAVGLKTVYTVSEPDPKWSGPVGLIDEAFIKKHVPDWSKRLFYISGPEPMVQAFEKMLTAMGVAKANMRRDFFPGYTA